MAGITCKSLDSPDETRTPPRTTVEVVRLGETTVARFTFQPGWRWSEDIKPVVGTPTCQTRHVGVIHSGTLHTVHDDGTEAELRAGDAYLIEPGHDGWVVGDEPLVVLEFESADTFAKA